MKNILPFALFALLAPAAQATVLTFDFPGGDGSLVPQNYGDNVTATTMGTYGYGADGGFTPGVTVDYLGVAGVQSDLNLWTTGFSDLRNVVEFEPDGFGPWRIRFTAADGLAVRLDAFDLGNFDGAVTLPSLSVSDGAGNVLWSMSSLAIPASSTPGHLSFAPNVAASTLVLTVDQSTLGGNSDNIGLDNIRFAQQPVPEPATLAALGLGALAFLRRRRL